MCLIWGGGDVGLWLQEVFRIIVPNQFNFTHNFLKAILWFSSILDNLR